MSNQERRSSRWPDGADLLGVVGVGLLSYGAWLIYQPAAFVVAGICLMLIAAGAAIMKARR